MPGIRLLHLPEIEPGLLRDPRYLRLWAAHTVSELGSGVGWLALSLTAVVVLQATADQMGLLLAAMNAPALLLGLVVGVWIDRLRRRRPLLVAADLGRAALLALVPLAFLWELLRIELLYAVAFLVGLLTVVFEVAVTSYLPALVERAQLLEANAKLQVSYSTAHMAGPAGGGWLIQIVSAPFALLADILSFVISGAMIASIRTPEPAPAGAGERNLWREMAEGASALWRDPLLRATTAAAAIGAFGGSIQGALLVLFASAELGLSAPVLGFVLASHGAAAILGAAITSPLVARYGVGTGLVLGQVAVASGMLLIPGAGLFPALAVPVLLSGHLLMGGGMRIFSINQISLRQAIIAPEVLGRVNATRRFIVFGIQPVGAICGGVLGSTVGLVPALLTGGCIQSLSVAALVFSPVPSLREPAADVHKEPKERLAPQTL